MTARARLADILRIDWHNIGSLAPPDQGMPARHIPKCAACPLLAPPRVYDKYDNE
jgi:hypothetical protein